MGLEGHTDDGHSLDFHLGHLLEHVVNERPVDSITRFLRSHNLVEHSPREVKLSACIVDTSTPSAQSGWRKSKSGGWVARVMISLTSSVGGGGPITVEVVTESAIGHK